MDPKNMLRPKNNNSQPQQPHDVLTSRKFILHTIVNLLNTASVLSKNIFSSVVS